MSDASLSASNVTPHTAPRAVIFGCAGKTLDDNERAFFRDSDPLGFILFARNCDTPAQIQALVGELRDSVGRADAPVLIDQEGGRVARLRPPHWRSYPSGAQIAALGKDAAEAARAASQLIADDLRRLGITVDCLPVLDLSFPGADAVIGDRSFGADPTRVAELGRAQCDGLLSGGVLPVIKHIPGHGRGTVDSHFALPVVDASREALEAADFAPFQKLNDAPWAMTAHIVYSALDPDRPATLSPTVIEDVIRKTIGFDGVLVSDDLSMQALGGSLGERATGAMAAGCDLVLHCNGKPDEMKDVADAIGTLLPAAQKRVARAEGQRTRHIRAIDRIALEARLSAFARAGEAWGRSV
jgi:beta-N-acetylhexosaminidase